MSALVVVERSWLADCVMTVEALKFRCTDRSSRSAIKEMHWTVTQENINHCYRAAGESEWAS